MIEEKLKAKTNFANSIAKEEADRQWKRNKE